MLARRETFLFTLCLLALAHSATQVCLFGIPCTGANTYCNGVLCACNSGYSGDGVTCTRVCPGDTSFPSNGGSGTCNTNHTVGQTCAQTCNTGYVLGSGNFTRTCQANGTWTPATAACAPKDCGPLTLPSNSYYDPPCTSTTYKSWCAYSCSQPNYVLQGQRNYTCNSAGAWERAQIVPVQNGICVSISCGDLPIPAHAVADPPCTLTTRGNTCAFDCLPPYLLVGQRNYTCDYFLNWDRTDVLPLQDGSCITQTWNGVILGSIVGNYTNGCNVQSLTSIANTFLLTCPAPLPKVAYLTFYQASFFTIAVEGYDLFYGGVNYVSSGSSTVVSIWLQTRNNTYTKGNSGILLPQPKVIAYSKYLESCWYDSLSAPIQDFQRCDTGLQCYFRGPSPQSIGQKGQCWYPQCQPSLCTNTTRLMRKGYCVFNGTSDTCVDYLPTGATGCGGYSGVLGVYPLCDPFGAYCLNVSGVNTCVLSACLNGGCNYGQACNLNLTTGTETCVGNGIPKIADSAVMDMLGEVITNLPPSRRISTQAFTSTRAMLEELQAPVLDLDGHSKKESLMMMPRVREGNQRSTKLLTATPCTIPANCGTGQTCVSKICQSPSGTPCLTPC